MKTRATNTIEGKWIKVREAVQATCYLGAIGYACAAGHWQVKAGWWATAITAATAAAAMLPGRGAAATAAQAAAFCLAAGAVQSLAGQYVQVQIADRQVRVAQAAVVLGGCAAGWLVGKRKKENQASGNDKKGLGASWLAALAVIGGHILALAAAWRQTYGFGYERDIGAAGQAAGYALLWALVWQRLEGDFFAGWWRRDGRWRRSDK